MARSAAPWIVGGSLLGAAIGLGAWALSGRRRTASGPSGRIPWGRARPVFRERSEAGTLTHWWDKGEIPMEERVGMIQGHVARGVRDADMRKLALKITSGCPARDGSCEARAVHEWVARNIRYTGDVGEVVLRPHGTPETPDLYQSPMRTIEYGGGDCLPTGTLMLAEGHELIPVELLRKGQRIWGLDSWTRVIDVWYKGCLPVDAVFLNNGSSFKATGDHKVYIADCAHDVARRRGERGSGCECRIPDREVRRITVAELEPGMVLLTPERIPFGKGAMDPDRAYVEGLYLSDGSSGHATSFEIAGQDGCPKEAQKREVAAICERLGIPTTWQRKYISVRDREWAARLQRMGQRAWNKRAPSIDLDEGPAAALLRGIMADSGANTSGNGRTFTSTSRWLTIQTRLLHKMFAVSCGERYVVDHGGFGEHPIWRLQTRTRTEDRKRGCEKLLRVKGCERDVMHLPVWDLTTEDHRVYLPEADVTVSQCDDHVSLAAALLALNGITPGIVVSSGDGSAWDHIFACAQLPKDAPSACIPVDTTLGAGAYGRRPWFRKARIFPG